ncbi:MAG: Card1-like endonuclease domain-containing protein [Gammaproteobacteria bacterium]
MTHIYIALVSDQLLPNLIPALLEKPERAVLVASKDMMANEKAQRLQKLLRAEDIEAEICGGAPSTGFMNILDYALNLADKIKQEKPPPVITLNATGGTKLMSMAFVEAFREMANKIIYTDTEHNVIEILVPSDQPSEPMPNVLDVHTYLAAQGMRVRCAASDSEAWRERADERKPLTNYLATQAAELDVFFGVLNGIIHGVPGRKGALSDDGKYLDEPTQNFTSEPVGGWKDAMRQIDKAGLVEWKKGSEFRLKDTDAARYLGGFWLEEYAWHIAKECPLQDVRCGVEITWEGGAKNTVQRNEFDLLAVHDNRLLVIECKTLRLGGGQSGKAQDMVYKLDSLGRNAGGTFGASLLLSVRATTAHVRERCKNQGIALCEGVHLKRLRQNLLDWKAGKIIAFYPNQC